MKLPKLLLLICCCFTAVCVFAQTADSIENDLIRSYRNINDDINSREKLVDLNQEFNKKLIHYTTSFPYTINYAFATFAKEKRVFIVSSEDKTFRAYSWDTKMGLTGIAYNTLIQYDVAGQCYARLLECKDIENPSPTYHKLYSFKMNGNTYCVALFRGAYSSRFKFTGLHVYILQGNNLQDAPIIKNNSKITHEIWINFDCYTCKAGVDIPEVQFDLVKRQITMPFADGNGKLKNHVITYQFTGKYFEKVKQ